MQCGQLAEERAQRVAVNGAVSAWQRITSAVAQESILGIVLFYRFINRFISDLDAGVEYIISRFVDDTKLGGAADSHEGQEAFQRDPNK